jgi:UDP-N-acetylglucosamine 2-epimerase (non-hydrolysing)
VKRIVAVLGTRPEKIKLAPVLGSLPSGFQVSVVETGQHTSLLDSAEVGNDCIDVVRLTSSAENLSLGESLGKMVADLSKYLSTASADLVLVQGDTASALAGALAARFSGIRVGHVEAGLRTHNNERPWPEELIRKTIGQLSDIHFPPTQIAQENLVAEGCKATSAPICGNTSVDIVTRRLIEEQLEIRTPLEQEADPSTGPIIVTLHRREAHGSPRRAALRHLSDFLNGNPRYSAHLVLHPNPAVVRDIRESGIEQHPGVTIVAPLSHAGLLTAVNGAPFVISDSGGIQEEAPSLGKTVFIARDETERPEAVNLGMNYLVGADLTGFSEAFEAWRSSEKRDNLHNPYGDGHAGEKIASAIIEFMK